MKLRLTRGICWLLVCSALVALVSVAQVIVLPALVRHVILSRLAEIGLPHADLDVRSCSWRSAELAGVCLDEQRCASVETLAVEYSLRSLMRGKVKRVQVAGGRLLLRIQDGKLDLGELARITFGTGGTGLRPPFEHIELRACTLAMDWDHRQIRIPCEGSFRHAGSGRVVHDLKLRLENTPVDVHATLDAGKQSFVFSVDANEVKPRALWSIIPVGRSWLPQESVGRIDLHVDGAVFPQDELTLSGHAQGETFAIKRFEASLPLGSSGHVDGNGRLARLSWEAKGHLPDILCNKLAARGLDTFELGDASVSGRLAADLSNRAEKTWPDLQVSDVNVVLAPGRVGVGRDVTVDGLCGVLKFSGHIRKGMGEIALRPGSVLACRAARIAGLTTDAMEIAFAADANQTAADFALGTSAGPRRVRLESDWAGTVIRTETNLPQAKIKPARIILDADFSSATPRVSVRAATDQLDLDFRSPALLVGLKGIVLETRYQSEGDAPALLESTLTCDTVAVRDDQSGILLALGPDQLAPMHASFDPQSDRGELHWQSPVQPDAPLQVEGSLDLSGPRPAGSLSVICRQVRLTEEQAAAKALAAVVGTTISGDFSVRALWNLQRGRITPRVRIGVTNATLAGSQRQARAEGVDGEIVVTGLAPVSTPGNQRFHVDRLQLGKLRLADGYVTLRWENDPPAVLIEKMDWGFLGGRLYSHAVRIRRDEARINLRLFADRLNVTEVLGLLFGERAAGEGTVHGTIPVSVARADPTDLTLGPGYLYSTSSEGWWRLEHDGAARTLRTLVDRQTRRFSTASGEQVRADVLVKGLLNFQYDLFKIDFRETHEGLLARVTLRGRSRDQQRALQFEQITLDFPGFDENLRKLLILQEQMGRPAEETYQNAER